MKQYPFRCLSVSKRIFNYRLSRARRIVEIEFETFASSLRIFLSPMLLSPKNAGKIKGAIVH